MSEEVVIDFLTATKSPGTFGDSGAVKKEENPFVHVLVFTSKRMICVKKGEMPGLIDTAMFGGLYALISATAKVEQGKRSRKQIEDMDSLNEILREYDHCDIDYSCIEQLELSRNARGAFEFHIMCEC